MWCFPSPQVRCPSSSSFTQEVETALESFDFLNCSDLDEDEEEEQEEQDKSEEEKKGDESENDLVEEDVKEQEMGVEKIYTSDRSVLSYRTKSQKSYVTGPDVCTLSAITLWSQTGLRHTPHVPEHVSSETRYVITSKYGNKGNHCYVVSTTHCAALVSHSCLVPVSIAMTTRRGRGWSWRSSWRLRKVSAIQMKTVATYRR